MLICSQQLAFSITSLNVLGIAKNKLQLRNGSHLLKSALTVHSFIFAYFSIPGHVLVLKSNLLCSFRSKYRSTHLPVHSGHSLSACQSSIQSIQVLVKFCCSRYNLLCQCFYLYGRPYCTVL